MSMVPSQQHLELRRKLSESIGEIRHYAVRSPKEAFDLSKFISLGGKEPAKLQKGLCKLILNAVEHGNPESSFDKNTAPRANRCDRSKEDKGQQSPNCGSHHVDVFVEHMSSCIVIYIFDQSRSHAPTPHRQTTARPRTGRDTQHTKATPESGFDHIEYNRHGDAVCCLHLKSSDFKNCSRCGLADCPFYKPTAKQSLGRADFPAK
ncbi:MAG: hypothetical protein AB3N28_15775 [Kordiimonas sp.]